MTQLLIVLFRMVSLPHLLVNVICAGRRVLPISLAFLQEEQSLLKQGHLFAWNLT
jgi:hypothetical protein